jgi:hypothetical protein
MVQNKNKSKLKRKKKTTIERKSKINQSIKTK